MKQKGITEIRKDAAKEIIAIDNELILERGRLVTAQQLGFDTEAKAISDHTLILVSKRLLIQDITGVKI